MNARGIAISWYLRQIMFAATPVGREQFPTTHWFRRRSIATKEKMTHEDNIDDLDLVEVEDEVEAEILPVTNTLGDPPKINYINNKEFLLEIHRSKLTYCVYDTLEHAFHDAIVARLDEITPELIEATRIRKAQLQTQAKKAALRAAGTVKQSELKEAVVDPATIPTESIVFRVMTSAHIPLDPDRKRKGKGENSNHTRTPFLPFKHYVLIEDEWKEVLRSHWQGTIEDGVFNMTRGTMTRRLAVMFMILVDRYSRRSNWRGYTYLDEMKSHALLQLSQIGLQFNEAVSDNPFAFYTTTIKNCFTRVLNLEKKNQNIRDDILIMHGASPSYTRQNDYEYEKAIKREIALGNIPAPKVEETEEAPDADLDA